jgi:hypothetical protein
MTNGKAVCVQYKTFFGWEWLLRLFGTTYNRFDCPREFASYEEAERYIHEWYGKHSDIERPWVPAMPAEGREG